MVTLPSFEGWYPRLQLVEHDRPLHLLDGLGDLDPAGAVLGAVEGGAAAEDAALVAQELEPQLAAAVARVEHEAMGVDDGGRAHVAVVAPEDGARGGARRAQDALGGVVEPLAVLGGLQALAIAGLLVVD